MRDDRTTIPTPPPTEPAEPDDGATALLAELGLLWLCQRDPMRLRMLMIEAGLEAA